MYITVANGITALRVLLFLWSMIVLFQGNVLFAGTLFAISWALDAVDGWFARRLGQATEFGSQFDKIVDRTIMLCTVFALIGAGYLPGGALFLLTRDIGLLPALTIHAARNERVAAVSGGKGMTFLQGAGLLWLLFIGMYPTVVMGVVGVVGAGIAIRHLRMITSSPA